MIKISVSKDLEYKMKNAKEIKEKEMKAAEAEMKKCKVSFLCLNPFQAK